MQQAGGINSTSFFVKANMAKEKKVKVKVEEDIFNPYADIDDVLDDIEKDYGLISSGMDKKENRLSTGLLVLDLIIGKGVSGGGWYTLFGGESCAKSTTATTIMSNSVNSEVPIIQLWDYEGSSEPNYLENILQAQGIKVPVEEIFGVRNPETSRYVVKPRVRLYNESLAEKFFDSIAKLQRYLPDKVKFGDEYFYVYNHTKENIALLKGKYDKSFYQKTGKMRIPAENSLPQALLIVDSYPAMLPEGQDVDDPKSAMAMQARMFSEQIKRIKGKMKSKRITVVGMNQLRDKPMVMYGCLHADCKIPFVDGRSFSIKEIVENRIEGEIWSYNEDNGQIEPREITEWHFNGNVEHKEDWLTITTDSVETSNGVMSLTVTLDHEIFTDRGWIRAKDLCITDKVLSTYTSTPIEAVPFLSAVLCGDSSLVPSKRRRKSEFVSIRSITEGLDHKFRQKGKYDITVNDNHNYIAGNVENGFLVHNSPTYEPGGQALKFYSDCRVQVSARSNIHGKGMLDEEPAYDGDGSDKYRYIHAKATKNKLSTPYLEGMMRVWVEDSQGKARGFDPVWDTWQYLLTTGQILGKRNSFRIMIPQLQDGKAIKWNDFKTLIIGTKKEQIKVFEKMGSVKPLNIRAFCKKQLAEGNGLTMFFENFKKHKVEEADD